MQPKPAPVALVVFWIVVIGAAFVLSVFFGGGVAR